MGGVNAFFVSPSSPHHPKRPSVSCGTSSAKLCRQVITSDRGHRIWLDLAIKPRVISYGNASRRMRRMCSSRVDTTSSSPVYPCAPPAGALEIWIIGNNHMAALLADKPARTLQHRSEAVTQHAIWTSNNFVSHFEPSVLSLSGSIRQFDPVGMLLIPLVLLG